MFETLAVWIAMLFVSAPKFRAGEVVIYSRQGESPSAGVIGRVRFVRPNDSKKRGWFYNLTLIELGDEEAVRISTYAYTVPEASLRPVTL